MEERKREFRGGRGAVRQPHREREERKRERKEAEFRKETVKGEAMCERSQSEATTHMSLCYLLLLLLLREEGGWRNEGLRRPKRMREGDEMVSSDVESRGR
jgi:hypothetical protein